MDAQSGVSANDYFAYFVADGNVMSEVEDQLATWFRKQKNIDLDVSHDNDHADAGRRLVVRHHEGGHGRGNHLRATLREQSPQGVWSTELLCGYEGDLTWIDLRVSNSEGRFVAV